MKRKALSTIIVLQVFLIGVVAQYPDVQELRRLEQKKHISNPEFKQTVKQSGLYNESDWKSLIDERWGEGLLTARKLEIFDEFWRRIDEQYACFPNSDVDWDSLRIKYRPEVEAGVSRGRFYAIIAHMSMALQEGHTIAYDSDIYFDTLKPGVPLMVRHFFHLDSHFGAAITPLPDSTLLVFKAVEDHPLGLEPGDRILGYEGIPWKSLFRDLLSYELPLTGWNWGSTPEAETHALLRTAGENWHLFDTIDIIKYGVTDTIHLPTSLMVDGVSNLMVTEQLSVPGIPDPDFARPELITWGIIDGTNIGYINILGFEVTDYHSESFATAIKDIMYNHGTEGLILDLRACGGGSQSPVTGLDYLFNQSLYTFETLKRTDPNDHYGFTVVDRSNLPYSAWPVWSEADRIDGTPDLYDKPIAILTGPYSHSYGDIFPVMARFHPYARTFGKPTSGTFSAVDGEAIQDIVDGWVMYFSDYINYLKNDPGKQFLVHTAPEPDVSVWLEPDGVSRGEDAVVNRAIEWIVNKVYPFTIPLSNTYYSPGSQFPAEVLLHNPNDHSVTLWSYLNNTTNNSVIDSVKLTVVDTTIYAGLINLPMVEKNFSVTFMSTDQDDGDIQELPLVNRFTTKGPVLLDHYEITSTDSTLNAGDQLQFKLFLKNNGNEASINNIKIRLTQIDSCARTHYSQVNSSLSLDSLKAGEVKAHYGTFTIAIENDCVNESTIPMQINICEGNDLFWIDTLYLNVVGATTDSNALTPHRTALHQNYPNPFTVTTTINYELILPGDVRLTIYDITGKEVKSLVNSRQNAGKHSVSCDANDMESGIYFYKLITGSFIQSRKMILSR